MQADSFHEKNNYDTVFQNGYKELNDRQKEAVSSIEGPVIVVAGPGTGKTQILALRVGNILRSTDAAPENVLCLTYTEAGTIAMRRRLLQFIGPDAYRVPIYTFHAFCNSVIQENPAYFNSYRELRQADDLEVRMLLKSMLDELPIDHPLRRLSGGIYYDVRNLESLFADMKKEDWNGQQIGEWCDKAIEDNKSNPKYIYKRKTKDKMPGDLKNEYFQEVERLEKTKAAAGMFARFNELMTQRGWYDYNDMILWVLRAFQKDRELLADYQERYQYFLVDEYQDTNGSQNELVDLLADFWERPNIFVVGDDDQAIYRFQGANIGNIRHFIEKYAPRRIVLTDNYRSSQRILDAAAALIEHNEERLTRVDTEIVKDLRAKNPEVAALPDRPRIIEYQGAHEEAVGTLGLIEAYHRKGIPMNQIAVIYRKHTQVEELVRVMEQRGIALNLKKKVDILQLPLIHQLCQLIEYLAEEYDEPFSGERRLFEIMHYPYFGIPSLDIARLSIWRKSEMRRIREKENRYEEIHLRELISDEEVLRRAGIKDSSPFLRFHENIDRWIREQHEYTIQVLFEKILQYGNIYQHIFRQPDKFWLLQVVKTFFDFIKDQTAKRPELSLRDLLSLLDNMKSEKIALPFQRVIQSAEGVNFMTVHASKGLEFAVVIMLGCTQKMWDKKPSDRSFRYTEEMAGPGGNDDTEDNRRLFFVGMTRAERELVLSYHLNTADDKQTDMCRFVAEVTEAPEAAVREVATSREEQVVSYLEDLLSRSEPNWQLIDGELVDAMLDSTPLSVTALNKYMNCKLSFYFEQVLRVPTARNVHMGFGSAMHGTLQSIFDRADRKVFPDLEQAWQILDKKMSHYRSHFTDREFEDRRELGRVILRHYYASYRQEWDLPLRSFPEKKITNVHHRGIPITGVLDRLDEYKSHYVVIDYKTGKSDSPDTRDRLNPPNEKNEGKGGDYWRQIVFYQLLLDASAELPKHMDSGIMDFLQPNKKEEMVRQRYVVSPEDRELVSDQLVDTYERIRRHEFMPGCGEDHCHWCNFVKNL